MNIYAPIILCFIPLITVFLLFKILIDGISIVKELTACLIGLIALIPITVLQFFVGDHFSVKNQTFFMLLLRAVLLYGFIEEGIKCGTLFLFPKKNINLKQMFLYSLLAGLFLGCFESVVYTINSIQKASLSGGEILLHMIYLRSFTSIAIHTFAAGLLGMFVYSVKIKEIKWNALVYAIMLHGLYDFFAIMPSPINLFSYVAILLLIVECRIVYARLN
ncbi:MAG: PrsW family intramembrane metalloprotease [Treponema sp.]|uniref:PrsW family glutamic-type intramembrane protease n=1 Tax=Treponema sp. TaxID=166 RepID=UPI001B771E7E|nr:PrsW family glutamic-type intramembrane protease [Treponema sp.]MBP5402093.1 PrsW family intramembrane metalloprotease [Treponema sp.]MBR5933428.1 PrsW family intramembrane metalloprotease [Treponema sp.]